MIRLFGFVVGASLAIAAILLVLGVPEFASEPAAESPLQEPAPAPEMVPEPEPPTEPEPEVAVVEAPEPEPLPAPPEPAVPVEPRWHSFWSPFGSRIAADGFVSRLESVTGFDYRVIRIDNGVYEVAFAYTDDSERDAMLSAIAAATGLVLPDS